MANVRGRAQRFLWALLVGALYFMASCGAPEGSPSFTTAGPSSAAQGASALPVMIHVHDAGAAYPLVIDPLIWGQQQKIVPNDGALGYRFGNSVALSEDTAFVGAWPDANGDASVYVFVRDGSTWAQQQRLMAGDGKQQNNFGFSIAISGNTALVGAPTDDDGGAFSGSAYVFERTGGAWVQQQKLVAGDADSHFFGISVALAGDTALVGSSRGAYVFERAGGVWAKRQKLVAGDGAGGDVFGSSVALSGDVALVGAYGADDVVADCGAAYVFERANGVWSQRQKLVASDGAEADFFGVRVALSGSTAFIGASQSDDAGADAGAVYVFERVNGLWAQQQKLVASDGEAGDKFGFSLALSADHALVGTWVDFSLEDYRVGSAYVFVRDGHAWSQQQKLTASDVQTSDFGYSVALSADTALVGDPFNFNEDGLTTGAVYSFVLAQSQGGACAAGAECASGFCVDGVCCDTACGGGVADDCQACSVAAGAAADGACGPRFAGASCRVAAHVCDAAEACDGVDVACPVDEAAPDGTSCEPGVCGGGACALYDVIALSGGGAHTLALRANGEVLAWGSDTSGQLGNGAGAGSSTTPVSAAGLSSVSAIAAGGNHSLALDFNGEVWAWGSDASGQLGNSAGVVNAQAPMKVAGLPPVTAIAAGTSHSLAVDDAGQVWAWGADTFGQIGDGGVSSPHHSPTLLAGLPYILAVSAGRNHSLALDADGHVWAWGHDGFGQLGNGSSASNSTVPVLVAGLSEVLAVAAGGDHSLALLYDASVVAWGRDAFGQLGNGAGTANVQSPAPVPGLSDVSMIAGGGDYSLALLYDGTVRAWGLDGAGQLGDGGTSGVNQQSPAFVSGLTDVQSIAAGGTHSLALRYDLSLWAWGADAQGQLGNGAPSSSQFTPARAGLF